jgi:type II secretory pathway component PulF
MAEASARTETFAYQAQTAGGQPLSGTIDAGDITSASAALQSLQLRITDIAPAHPPTARATLRGADFLAFNQQLAQLTAGGLPIERSLRLLALEMRGRPARAVNEIAADLEKGTPLEVAFAGHAALFPPLYGLLVKAGVESNNLPAMLLNLGRHVEMIQRLRAAIWRAVMYPLSVLVALLIVMTFVWTYLIPQFAPLITVPWTPRYYYRSITPSSPPSLDWVVPIASALSFALIVFVACILLAVLLLAILARMPAGRRLVEPLVLPLPLIGPILRWNLLARWCDALRLGVEAGLDLPAALSLAGNAIDSPRLRADSKLLMDSVAGGQALNLRPTRLLPPLVPAALQLGAEQNDLPAATAMLAKMYQEQAEIRLSVLPQVLSPLLLILTATCVGLAVAAVLLPLFAVLRALSSM